MLVALNRSIMSKQQSKQTVQEGISKARLSVFPRLNDRITFSSESKKRILSKTSVLGSVGSRVFFHRRDRLKIPKYQNTYRLESFRSFHAEAVDKIVRCVMENKLSPLTSYQPDQSAKLCLEISADVQRAISKKDYDRYKIVTQVSVIQRLDQSAHAAFQCLWDTERDNYSYYVFENSHIYAWCCVFGIYYE